MKLPNITSDSNKDGKHNETYAYHNQCITSQLSSLLYIWKVSNGLMI